LSFIQWARLRQWGSWSVLNALWIPLSFQDAALMTIAVPAALLVLAPESKVAVLAVLTSIAGVAAMIVPPLAGWFSDHLRRGGGNRRAFVVVGIGIDVAALSLLAFTHNIVQFGICLVLAVIGANIALAAYQALLPELVERSSWGAVSGVRSALTLVGTILGLTIAGTAPSPWFTFAAAAIVVAVCAVSLAGVHEGEWTEPDHVHVRDWHDFLVVFAARVLVFFGLILLQTYTLFYFKDIQGLANPSTGMMLAGFSTMIGTIASSIYLGILSDRVSRKIVTSVAGIPMAIAAIGFAIAPAPQWIFLYAFLFGIGFGGVLSAGWALAMDSIPAMRDVARDLGLWGIATNLPNAIAPLIGGWLIGFFHGTRAGYQAVFGLAGFSFFLASLAVLRVGRQPLSSLWGWPIRFTAVISNYTWNHLAYRIRVFGSLPRRRGATLIVANHQHELEGQAIVTTTIFRNGPWRHPLYMINGRRMFEPGFLAGRLPFVRFLLRNYNAKALFGALGMMPLENELSSRELAALAWSVQRRHGPLPLADVFDERTASRFAPGTKTNDLLDGENFEKSHATVKLATLRDPYRREVLEETRRFIDQDLTSLENVLRRGATFYLTPEGFYSVDGRIGQIKAVYDRLAPLATIYLAAISYDPFVSKRLPMIYRFVRLDDREHMKENLAAARPVTTSQILGSWLDGRTQAFTLDEAVAAVKQRLDDLPPSLFVDPELRHNPERLVRAALPLMVEWKILERESRAESRDAHYRLAAVRRHPQFTHVDDIVSFNARMLEETVSNAAYSLVTV
jgi:MFS family permease